MYNLEYCYNPRAIVVASTMPSVTEKVAMRSDWQSKIGLAYALDHLATFRAIRELHHQFPNGPNLRKDQVEERLVAS